MLIERATAYLVHPQSKIEFNYICLTYLSRVCVRERQEAGGVPHKTGSDYWVLQSCFVDN